LIHRLVAAAAAVLFLSLPASAQTLQGEMMVDASLVSDRASVAPGETFHLGLHQDIEEGWHTYWRNPGDSGEATRIFLDLPEGWTEGEIIWPAPRPYNLGPLTNYGYSGEVTLPVPVTVPADAQPGMVTITGEATWLVCEDICIPEEDTFEITIEVGESAADSDGEALIGAALASAPETIEDARSGLRVDEGRLILTVNGDFLVPDSVRGLYFFPFEGGVLDHNAEQPYTIEAGQARLDTRPGFLTRSGVNEVRAGALAFETSEGGDWTRRVVELRPEADEAVNELAAPAAGAGGSGPGAAAGEGGAGQAAGGMGFVQAAFLALIGGLILNLMPCVFPVLSMKAVNLVNKRGADRAHARELGLIFGAGVIATFLALGGLVLVLRAFGGMESWGFQLQEPAVVAGLAALMFLIGLNFLGVFEIGTSLQGVGGNVKSDGRWGSFLTGVLAVFVAAPCLAPFMTGALTFALTQPPHVSLAIFAFLGIGLALPFVGVSFFPQALNVLPKPGPWMERFKQVLAFPMFATGIWLVFVLGMQTGAMGVAWLLITLLAISFAIWAVRIPGRAWKVVGAVGAVLALGAFISTVRLDTVAVAAETGEYETWSPERVAELRAEGRPVFVDFTAAWCVTCQVNKLGALADSRVRRTFAENDVALLRADFTNRDHRIAETLASYGAPGVPFYLMYPADGGEPEILPPLLTESIMTRAVNSAISTQGPAV
jgi:thiol:disulfide interchange protein/DsbC/DsbD-like thiol-disulfide interchange protein